MLSEKTEPARAAIKDINFGETSIIIRKTWSTLLIVFMTSTATFMLYPSVIYMFFTLQDHYKQVILNYDYTQGPNGKQIFLDAAKDFLTIYAFFIIFAADLFAIIVYQTIPDKMIRFLLNPLLTITRISIAIYTYWALYSDKQNPSEFES